MGGRDPIGHRRGREGSSDQSRRKKKKRKELERKGLSLIVNGVKVGLKGRCQACSSKFPPPLLGFTE